MTRPHRLTLTRTLPYRAAAAGEMCCLAKGAAYWGEFFAGTRITGGAFRANRPRPQGWWVSGAGSWNLPLPSGALTVARMTSLV
jgi:hypothetical protein